MLDEQRLKIKQFVIGRLSNLPKFPSLSKFSVDNSRKRLIILLLLLALFLSITVIAAWQLKVFPFNRRATEVSKEVSPSPSPRPIPHGKKGFTVSQSDKTVPQFGKGSIDPYDPENGAIQTVTIAVKHNQPVTEVTAVLKTDNTTSQPYSFKLISGSATDGQWQGSWQINDTYLYTYALTLNAVSANGSASVEITLR